MSFTHQQYLVIRGLADGIFPPMPDSPAASDLPVADMFRSIAESWDPGIFEATANALDVVNNIAISIFGAAVQDLSWRDLEELTNLVANSEALNPFWEPFRLLITLSYYALPPAYRAIGLPGPTIDLGGLTSEGYPA